MKKELNKVRKLENDYENIQCHIESALITRGTSNDDSNLKDWNP